MISLKTHNMLDYAGGLLLLLTPSLFGFAGIEAARNFFVIGGLGLIVYSLFTQYEIALWKVIPVQAHMALDVALGAVTILAPYLFGYSFLLTGTQAAVHWILGLAVIAMVAFTERKAGISVVESDIKDFEDFRKTG